MGSLEERVRDKSLLEKITDPLEAVDKIIPRKGSIAFSGMSNTGYSKVIVESMKKHVLETGEEYSLTVYSAGTAGIDHEEALSIIGVKRRYPFGASSKTTRMLVNKRRYQVSDMWLYKYNMWLYQGVFDRINGKIDVAVIEATGITEDGIIPSMSLDAAPAMVKAAKKVIVELSLVKPILYGLHDITGPNDAWRIKGVLDRVGSPIIRIPRSKIAAIVVSSRDDQRGHYTGGSTIDEKVAENIARFLDEEAEGDPNLRRDNITLQPGAGPIASILSSKIVETRLRVSIWGEVASLRWVDALGDSVGGISASVLYTLPGDERLKDEFYGSYGEYRDSVVLRPQYISNNPQILTRYTHITVQQAIEVDVYGNANISHIGSSLYGGVGGSGDHARSSYITILALPSITSSGIPRIVPYTFHTDLTEHDVDVIVTEQGWADLRGLSPLERAKRIIEECAHPSYKDDLLEYLDTLTSMRGHQPINLEGILKFMEKHGINLS